MKLISNGSVRTRMRINSSGQHNFLPTSDYSLIVGNHNNPVGTPSPQEESDHYIGILNDNKFTQLSNDKYGVGLFSRAIMGGNYTGGYVIGGWFSASNELNEGNTTSRVYGLYSGVFSDSSCSELIAGYFSATKGNQNDTNKISAIHVSASGGYNTTPEINNIEIQGYGSSVGNVCGTVMQNLIKMTHTSRASNLIGTVRGISMVNWVNGGTTDNSYAIYIDNTVDIGAVSKYCLYSLSTSPSLLSGNLTIGGAGKFFISTPQTPASGGASGTAGQIAWDSSYIYVCTATNTWKRATLNAF